MQDVKSLKKVAEEHYLIVEKISIIALFNVRLRKLSWFLKKTPQ